MGRTIAKPAHDPTHPIASSEAAAPGGRGLHPIWSLLRFTLCLIAIGSILTLLASPWLELSTWKIFRRCVSIAAMLSLWLCVRRFERRSFRSYGLAPLKAGRPGLIFGALLGLGSLGLLFVLGLVTETFHIEVTPDRLRLWRTVLGFIPAAALVSLLEELVFRGFILQQLLAYSRPFAVLASSAVYALVHVKGLSFSSHTYLELGGLFLFGGVLAVSYLLTQQLYIAMGLHAVLAYGARVNKLLIEFTDPSRSWLVGTSRLVNGLVGWVAILLMGIAIIWWTRKLRRGGLAHEAL